LQPKNVTENGTQYLVIYDDLESIVIWVDRTDIDGFVTLELVYKQKALDLSNDDKGIVSIAFTDNLNFELYTESMNRYSSTNGNINALNGRFLQGPFHENCTKDYCSSQVS